MRSSSVKTFVTVLSLVATLAITVPAAAAQNQQPQAGEAVATQRDEPRGIDRFGRTIRRLLVRLATGITVSNWPTVPIPNQ
jgi:hypothetical protein